MNIAREDVLRFFRETADHLAEAYGVRRIGLFGSVARDEAAEASDMDVLVHMDAPTFERYMDLKFEIEDRFGVSVDLVLADTLKERLRPVIEKEVVYA